MNNRIEQIETFEPRYKRVIRENWKFWLGLGLGVGIMSLALLTR